MAIKINKVLNTEDGFQVPSGTHVQFITEFKENGIAADVAVRTYVNEASADAGKSHYRSEELKGLSLFTIDLTTLSEAEKAVIAAASNLIHEKVKEKIDSVLTYEEGENSEIV